MADLNGLLTVPYQPSGFGGQLNSMLAPPQPRARTLEEEYELLRSGMLPGDYAVAVQARSGEPQRFVNDLGQMYSASTPDEARSVTTVLHPDAPADARPTTWLTGDTPLGSELRLPSSMDARRSAPGLLQPGMPLFSMQPPRPIMPGAATPSPAQTTPRRPEMLQPLAGVRDARLLPAPAGRTEALAPTGPADAGGPQYAPPPAPVSRAPGVSVGGDAPTQPSQMAADALLRPAPQQSPLAGALSGLSPEQRTAAMLHVIKGDWGELAKMLTDTPQARADRLASEEAGKARGRTLADLPQATQTALSMIANIERVIDDKNVGYLTGWSGLALYPQERDPTSWWARANPLGWLPNSPATDDTLRRIEQIRGQAFMQAFQQLRGAGAISEAEGKVAQEALTRLGSLRASDEGYMQALREARREVAGILNAARAKAGLPPVSEPDVIAAARQTAGLPASSTQEATDDAVRITGDADYNALPSGTRFIGPDGSVRIKP